MSTDGPPALNDREAQAASRSASPDADLQKDTEDYLRRLGVPAFAGRGAIWKHGRIIPLIWMLAFEVGVATAAKSPLDAMIFSAPIIAFVAVATRSFSSGALGVEDTRRGWWLLPLIVVPVTGFFILRDTVIPLSPDEPIWFWPHLWSDAAVMLATLYAAMILLVPQAQGTSPTQVVISWLLIFFVAVATIALSALFPLEWSVGNTKFHTSFLPLLVAALILTAALVLLKLPGEQSTTQSSSIHVPAVLLILIFGFDNSFLIYVYNSSTAAMITTALVAIVLLWAVMRYRGSKNGNTSRTRISAARAETVKRQIDEPKLRYWVPIFLFTYPSLNLILNREDTMIVLGRRFAGLTFTGLLVLFNTAYVLLIWILVGFGITYVVTWAAKDLWHKKGDILVRMAGAAPLLLIFVAFFALAAETWQISYSIELTRLMDLLALLLVIAVTLVFGWSVALLLRVRSYSSWEEVATELEDCPHDREFKAVPERLRVMLQACCHAEPPDTKLNVMAWLNALFILFAFQFALFASIAVSLLALFLVLVWLAVPPGVAAAWIFGDGQEQRQSELVKLSADGFWRLQTLDVSLLASPWLRVSIFLTLFCVLWFAAESLAKEESRHQFFRGTDSAMRQRFAIRLAHREISSVPKVWEIPYQTERSGEYRTPGAQHSSRV